MNSTRRPNLQLSLGHLPLVANPGGMTISDTTGVVSWPGPTVAGSPHTITIRATNGTGSDDESWLLTVTSSVTPPVITSISDDSLEEGTPYTGPTPVLSSGTQPVTWTLVANPGGMTISDTTGVVSWPGPTVAGSPHTITIRATNGTGSDDESWLLTVTSSVTPPVITSISDDSLEEGTPYTGPTPVLSSGTQPVTWTLEAGPSGMTINDTTGVVSWASPTIAGSPHTITIRATNSAGSKKATWLLTVSSSTFPEIALVPGSLTFIAATETDPPSQSFEIQNAGTGTLDWSATTVGGDWLSVSPLTGTAPSTLTVTVNSAGLAEGTYAGTITVAALSSSNASNSPQVLAVSLVVGAPVIGQNGIVNGASFRPATDLNGAVTPGAIVAIFGTDMASSTEVASEVPLPTKLGDTSVTFNGIAAPLFFVSPGQINAQVPFELVAGADSVTVQLTRGSETSELQSIALAAVSPGIFTLNAQGTGAGAILHAADFQPVTESNPALPGEFLLIFCTGLGPVLPEVPSGNVAPGTEPLARTVSLPLVNIGGIPAEVVYSGLAPGFVGLYQVNVEVPVGVSPPNTQPPPEGLSPPNGHDLEIINNGVPSNIVEVIVGASPPNG